MSQNYRVRVTVELDVVNAESESQARQTVFSLLSTPPATSKGRPTSGPRATVTGLTIGDFSSLSALAQSLTQIPSHSDAME